MAGLMNKGKFHSVTQKRHTQENFRLFIGIVVVGLAAVGIFLNSLYGDLVFDDVHAIIRNRFGAEDYPCLRYLTVSCRDVLGETPISSLWVNDYWGDLLSSNESHKSYRPLTVLTFRINHAVHGLSPVGYHLVNVVAHALVSILSVLLYHRFAR